MNRKEAAQLVAIVAARYPRASAQMGNPADTATAWWMTLSDVPYAVAESVLADWFKTSRFVPDPSEVRNTVLALAAVVPTPEDAWELVLRHMRENGHVGGTAFAGPEVVGQTVQAIGGWYRLRLSERPEEDRAAFVRAYATMARRAAASANVVELIRERTPQLEAEVG